MSARSRRHSGSQECMHGVHSAACFVWHTHARPALQATNMLSSIPIVCMQVPYSRFISGLQTENIQLNRKVLSELAMNEPFSFKALVDQVKFMRGLPPDDGSERAVQRQQGA